MDMTFSISIPCDDDGFLTLLCPSCKSNFKLKGSDYNDDSVIDIYCPYCGLSDKTSSFLPDEVREAALREAENLAMEHLNKEMDKMLSGFGKSSGLISVKKTSKFKPNAKKELFEENNMTLTKFECCSKDIKVEENAPHTLFYCPFCGVNA